MMGRGWRVWGALALGTGVMLVSTGCQKLKARDELNKAMAIMRGTAWPSEGDYHAL